MANRIACSGILLLWIWAAPFSVGAEKWQVVTEEFPPYNYMDNGEVAGFATELLRVMFDNIGLSYDISLYPWARAYLMAQQPNTMIYSIARAENREETFQWVGPLGEVRLYLWQRKEAPKYAVTDVQGLSEINIAVLRESLAAHKLEYLQQQQGITLHLVNTALQALGLVAKGRVDAAFVGDIRVKQSHTAAAISQFFPEVERRQLLLEIPLHLAVHDSASPELISRLQQQLDTLKESGFYQQLRKKYKLD